VGSDTAVSCAGNNCTSTGFYGSTPLAPQIHTEVSGVWSPADAIIAPQPTTANGAQVNAVSCATSDSCVVVGTANNPGNGSAGSYALIDSGGGASYTGVAAPLPSDGVATGVTVLSAVSCPATGSCGAVGFYKGTDEVNSFPDSLLEIATTSGGTTTWTPTEVPVPPGNASGAPGNLNSVSCVAGWGCVATGDYTPDGGGATENGEIVTAPL
jgi:hypothetical protein